MVLLYGSTYVIHRKFTAKPFDTWRQVRGYMDDVPDDLRRFYSATWRLINAKAPRPKRTKPAAKRTWSSLSPRTKQGYRGYFRRQLGLSTEAQIAHAYETAPDLRAARRHPSTRLVSAGGEELELKAGFLVTWQKHG